MDIDASRAAHLVKCLQEQGLSEHDVTGILTRCGIPKKSVWPVPEKITYLEEAELVRAACDAVDDVTFAAASALSFRESTTITGYIGKYSRNLGDAIENTARFHDLIDPALAFNLRVSSNVASIEISWKDASFGKFHRHTEYLLFLALSRMRHLAKTGFYPLEIRFDHQAGKSASSFSKIGGFPVVFEAEKPEIVLGHTTLELPIPSFDPKLRDHLIAYGNRLLSEVDKPTQNLRAIIESQIIAVLPGKVPSAEEVAGNLGLSTRTFGRRLTESGLRYRTIVDDLRYDLAKTLIKDGMSMTEVAFSIGYADQAAFSTAFKRWSGSPPSASINGQDS
ncbi:helix-turn-helix domain-containing protein [Ruegeria lacuscaerulensis]|uniref:helix-turn-helix domain-containing protein n=1 Tax=Ruegeria lacuscaerulensis TaxID=55218 RepID=UPI00147F8BC2|nr:AraC family transcriptional regulator [Ruegeria lacuscaerulensis]